MHKILVGMTVLLLFPVVIAAIYEYTKINENEELISTVYKNQLETIVSSVNSYTQDIANNWGTRLELWYRNPSDTIKLKKLVSENQSIKNIFLVNENNKFFTAYGETRERKMSQSIDSILKRHTREIAQLKNYYKNGYRKFISISAREDDTILFFIAKGTNLQLCTFLVNIDLQEFLQNQVSPRVQSIAQEHFRIDLLDKKTGELLITTEKEPSDIKNFDQEGDMWFFPQIKIGISLKSQTVTSLATKRIKEGLVVMGLVLLVLLVGLWFLFVSVKREIQLAQIKSEFISNVSHEIRTPLALISMYIETLEMGRIKTSEKVKEYYQIISKETQRLTGIVNKILNFSRLESGRQKFEFSNCDLNTITRHVLDTYQFHLQNKGFDVSFQPASVMPDIRCDKDAISDALINIIDNAIKYSRNHKKIEIKTGIKKKYAFVEVKDHGPGIPRKKQKMVFDKFYRVTTGHLANEVKGSGLGLAIVNEVIKAHRGKVTLNSKIGEGAAFRLYFLIAQSN